MGRISPQLLQKVMFHFADGLKLYDAGTLDTAQVEKFAGLKTNGRPSSNIWRDLKQPFPKPKLPKLNFLPMRHNMIGRLNKPIPTMLPHAPLLSFIRIFQTCGEELFALVQRLSRKHNHVEAVRFVFGFVFRFVFRFFFSFAWEIQRLALVCLWICICCCSGAVHSIMYELFVFRVACHM